MRSSRQVLRREQIRGPLDVIALVIGTFFGAGLLPKMPGTWGTLFAVPVAYGLHLAYPNPFQPEAVIFWLVLLVLGTWACQRVCAMTGTADNQILVIDEVVGYGITAALAGIRWDLLWICFFLFRVLDVTKVPPVRQLDRLSKGSANTWVQGFGVMADDVVAGIQGFLLFYFAAPSLLSFLSRFS